MLGQRAFCRSSLRCLHATDSAVLGRQTLRVRQTRLYSAASHERPHSSRKRALVFTTLFTGASAALFAFGRYESDASFKNKSEDNARNPLAIVPFSALLRGYFVYTCCSFKVLVDNGPALIDWCSETSIPGIWPCFEYIMRRTFFAQFVGGESAQECIDRGKQLFNQKLGVILNYSAEFNEKKSSSKLDSAVLLKEKLNDEKIDAILDMIRLSAISFSKESEEDSSNRARDGIMIAVKLSGLIKDASVLERASACLLPREQFSEPPRPAPPSTSSALVGPCASINIPTATLSQHDVDTLQQLWTSLQNIATCAQDNGNIRILIDAEHSWYQPAIDALSEACARHFNAIPAARSTWWRPFDLTSKTIPDHDTGFKGPLVYNTLQTYLRRTPAYLAMSLERAKQGHYALGIKLVRGAYVEQENEQWASKVVTTPPSHNEQDGSIWKSPVWPTKYLTDQCFDNCAALLIKEIAKEVNGKGNDAPEFAHLGLILASHNWLSNMKAIQQLVDLGLANNGNHRSIQEKAVEVNYHNLQIKEGVRGRLHFAQLYGMADHLSRAIQTSFDPDSGGVGPHLVLKFVPFGDLRLVMPYLIRRANENKSLMNGGGAKRERSLLASEMLRRLRFF